MDYVVGCVMSDTALPGGALQGLWSGGASTRGGGLPDIHLGTHRYQFEAKAPRMLLKY